MYTKPMIIRSFKDVKVKREKKMGVVNGCSKRVE